MVITLAVRTHSTAGDLLRLLATWLAVIVIVQGLAAARALGTGPLHRHVDGAATPSTSVQHRHDDPRRHHHAVADSSVAEITEDGGIDTASFAITAAMALMALRSAIAVPQAAGHVWRAAPGWAWRSVVPVLPLKPPRRG